jgi:hypothetical protein
MTQEELTALYASMDEGIADAMLEGSVQGLAGYIATKKAKEATKPNESDQSDQPKT